MKIQATKLFALVSLSVLLASCRVVGPNYTRPVVPAPDTFRAAPDTAAADPASLADLKWFELFKDPALQNLINIALEQNHDLRSAIARIDIARANLGITRADQKPTIGVSAELITQRSSSNGLAQLPANVEQRRTVGGIALNLLSYEADIWGRLRRATEASQANLLASDESRKAVMTTLVSDVAGAYFNLLELDAELEIARRTLATREASLKLIQNRMQGGVATQLEVRQGEQLVHFAARSIPAIEQEIEQTENHINLLLGQNPGPITRGRSLMEQEQPVSVPPGLPSELLERRPDIRVAEQQLVAANATIGVAKAAYYPKISLTSFLGSQSSDLTSLFTGPTGVWQFVPQVTQPLFTGGRTRSTVELASAQEQLAVIQYERSIQTAFREVSDALVQYQKVKDIRAKQEELVGTLQDRSRLSYMRYRGGVDTLLNALDADRDLFDAELGLAQTRRDELVTLVQLYKALGGGWQQ
ncbi:MAG TPA: efflux transporter outer membrane subunit [Terriglobia bacterium]|nr:efflux transporter outer membrane subunit [Terriglobia bacterium]